MTAILDGTLTLPAMVGIRWGAVVVQPVRATGTTESVTGARTLSARLTFAIPVPVAQLAGPVIVRDPSHFISTIAAALGGVDSGTEHTLAAATARALNRPECQFAEGPTASRWLPAARDILHAQFDHPISMRDLARTLGVHPVHASRAFANRYRMTMTSYLRDLRLMRASELILRTSDSLSRIALRTGFADHAHLTRVFRARTGRPPSALRCEQGLRLAS